jgi:hypothetical protein
MKYIVREVNTISITEAEILGHTIAAILNKTIYLLAQTGTPQNTANHWNWINLTNYKLLVDSNSKKQMLEFMLSKTSEVFVFDNTHEFAKWLVEKTKVKTRYTFEGDLTDV